MIPNVNLSNWIYKISVAVSIAFYIFIVTGNPISVFVTAAHDDALFFRSLDSMLRGEWLGLYDNRTLVKGPMLPIVGAVGATFGVSAKIIEAVIYLFSVLSFFLIAKRIGLRRSAIAMLVVLLLFNPYLYAGGNRYLRDFLYSSFVVLAVVMAVGSISTSRKRAGTWFAAGAGFFVGCALLTREEDVWLIATLGCLLVTAFVIIFFRSQKVRFLAVVRFSINRFLVASLALSFVILPVLLGNYVAYGNAVVSEFRSVEFRSAMGALMRVGERHESGYVPVTQRSLAEVFQVAPIAAGIREHWPRLSSGWAKHGAHLVAEYPGEVAGGWFVWAFRDAAAAAGHHSSAAAASNFYARLAVEVNTACETGRLVCRRERVTLAPELTMDRLPKLIAASVDAVLHSVSIKGGPVIAARSDGETSILLRWNQLIGPVVTEPSREYLLSGWVANLSGQQPLIAAAPGSPIRVSDLSTNAGNDVVEYFNSGGIKGVAAVRFSMIAKCLGDGCAVFVVTADGKRQMIKLDRLAEGRGVMTLQPPFTGWFDVVTLRHDNNLNPRPLEELRMAIASKMVNLVQAVIPLLTITSTLGVFLFLKNWREQRRHDWLFVLAIGAGFAVLIRSVVIAFIDITSWHAINVNYLGPAYSFVIIYSVVGTIILLNNIKRKNWEFPAF
jgi:hypothetical protein